METMLALVKKEAKPGLWLDEVPLPRIGINDVLIKVLRTGICGTDVHIETWDAWASKTVPVPLVIGHEFVGQIVEVGSNVTDFHVGEIVSGEGHVVCGRCRNCLAGRRHLCKDTKGIGVNRPGAFAQYLALPMTNVWAHDPNIPRDVQAIFDPFGNAVHTALQFDVARRRRADHRRRPDRNHGRERRPPRRCPPRRGDRRQSLSPRAGPADGRDPDRRRPRALDRKRPERAGNERGVRHRPRDVRQPRRLPRHARRTCATAARSPCWESPLARSRSTGTRSSST